MCTCERSLLQNNVCIQDYHIVRLIRVRKSSSPGAIGSYVNMLQVLHAWMILPGLQSVSISSIHWRRNTYEPTCPSIIRVLGAHFRKRDLKSCDCARPMRFNFLSFLRHSCRGNSPKPWPPTKLSFEHDAWRKTSHFQHGRPEASPLSPTRINRASDCMLALR